MDQLNSLIWERVHQLLRSPYKQLLLLSNHKKQVHNGLLRKLSSIHYSFHLEGKSLCKE